MIPGPHAVKACILGCDGRCPHVMVTGAHRDQEKVGLHGLVSTPGAPPPLAATPRQEVVTSAGARLTGRSRPRLPPPMSLPPTRLPSSVSLPPTRPRLPRLMSDRPTGPRLLRRLMSDRPTTCQRR